MNLNKKIALGVTGGIAAYKACELVRDLKRSHADVRLAITQAGLQFVSELTFATLSGNPVGICMFEGHERGGIDHIELARWCDAFVVCPATANVLGKLAAGLADDLITTTVLATRAPVVLCPAMNSVMWENEIVQDNVEKLKRHGFEFVNPEWGSLATQTEGEGWGRLASVSSILGCLKQLLLATDDLKHKKVVITAGPTREAIDPVRFLSNYSTGKMGFALAEAARLKNAEVVLIAGPNHRPEISGVKYVQIESAEEMRKAVEAEYADADVLIMSAAVSDYRPEKVQPHKIKKGDQELSLRLRRTRDILAELGRKKSTCVHVGFSLETQDLEKNAAKKLRSKNLDMIVLNNPLDKDAGFAKDTNVVTLIDAESQMERLPKLAKSKVASTILNRIVELLSLRDQRLAVV